MTTIHRATPSFCARRQDVAGPDVSGSAQRPHPFSRTNIPTEPNRSIANAVAAAFPRDRAFQELAGLRRDIEARLGPKPLVFPFGGGLAIVERNGPGEIVCSGPNNFYFEIVDGQITDREALTDAQISGFLGAAKTALG